MKRRKKRQEIKIYGFPFPQQLLDDLEAYQTKHNVLFPASAYAALLCVLKQIHKEKTKIGEVHEFKIAEYSQELDIPYSTLYTGLKFLEMHGFVYESINTSGKSVIKLHNYSIYHGANAEKFNYFTIPHSLFTTNIMQQLVRTANARVFELFFLLMNQFRNGIANVTDMGKVEEVVYSRTMSTLKKDLGKRSKGVRDAISLLEPLFNITYVGLTYRKEQKWITKIEFSLKPHTVIENTDAFDVHPLMNELQGETEVFFDENGISYKPRDLFDIMVSFKYEVIEVLKYVSKDDGEYRDFSERDAHIQSFYYRCLGWFNDHINKMKYQKQKFHFSKSIGGYFRTIFRNHIQNFIEKNISSDVIIEANWKEYVETGKVPVIMKRLPNFNTAK
ncbi:hypothetical protein EKG37_17555 [Robertmurraya yapensis]|uniref:Uncharacterized protein n=3 Tax=Bacillaceae TaxID=186817 RepID=A0A431VY09_9BACI|nr:MULTISPECIES: hypothetical protein [Bacillaceae]RTR28110.1 hypothetical protein EKG37_17555 [Bacillus yapensis]TKC15169.1 hypothetical protein FA727_20015 [Robertmurraya kyonggiensis]TKS94352.1 hypothetical protein FAR12_17555 [Bacillus yapensis]